MGEQIEASQDMPDEEIDSDLASGPDLPESSSDEASLLREGQLPPSQQAINDTATLLSTGLDLFPSSGAEGENPPLDNDVDYDSDDSYDSEPDAADVHANIIAAATGRDLSLGAARVVDPCNSVAPTTLPISTHTTPPSHRDMVSRILDTVRSNYPSNSQAPLKLVGLEKKIEHLHHGKKTSLPVPLPAPVSARLERTVAYKQITKSLSEKWTDTVLQNRRAEHLKFPLDEPRKVNQSTNDLAFRSVSQDSTVQDFEREITDILEEAGVIQDSDVFRSEKSAINDALASGKLSKEDVLRKQRELARVRSLVFYYDQKMKRIKRIKSKKYRKHLKKDRERLADDNDLLSDGSDQEGHMAAERRRVEERVTLRHKNTSKWIRRQLRRGEGMRDETTKAAIEEQLRLHQELKRRQLREVGNGESDSEGGEDSDPDKEVGLEEEEISRLEKELRNDEPNGRRAPKQGLMSLRFMQAAEDRKRKEALALLKEMKDDPIDDDDLGKDRVVGRNVFSGEKKKRISGEQVQDKLGNKLTSLADSLAVGVGDDGNNEVELLEQRVKEEYDDDVKAGLVGDSVTENVDTETATEVIRNSALPTPGFTTRLNGRLTADSGNPWLNGTGTENSGRLHDSALRPRTETDSASYSAMNDKHERNSNGKRKSLSPGEELHQASCESNCDGTDQDNEKLSESMSLGVPVVEVNVTKMQISSDDGHRENTHLHQASLASRATGKTGSNRSKFEEGGVQKEKLDDSELILDERITPNQKRGSETLDTGRDTKCRGSQIPKESSKLRCKGVVAANGSTAKRRKKNRNKKSEEPLSSSEVNKSSKGASDALNKKGRDGTDGTVRHNDADGLSTSCLEAGAPGKSDMFTNKSPPKETVTSDLSRMEDIARAFAGAGGADLADFEAIKAAEVEKSLPTAKSINAEVLPGWGSWDGAGMGNKSESKIKESAFARAARERLEAARANVIQSRSDRHMRNVILEQRRYQAATKLTMASVPYPYQSREQWERELSRPLCRELVSNRALHESVKRKAHVKLGTVMEPLQEPTAAPGVAKADELFKRRGKKAIIDLRKSKAGRRTKTRRGLMS